MEDPWRRMKSGQDLLVPLTDPLLEVLEGDAPNEWRFFVFSSPGPGPLLISTRPINQHFIRMGYKGLQTAHGWRRTALTAGQDGWVYLLK